MSPSHLSHNDLAELVALPFEGLPEHVLTHLAQCTHCADDYASACDEHATASAALLAATSAGWQPQSLASERLPLPWVPALSLTVGIALALCTAPGWSVHLAAISLNRTAHLFAGGARWFSHMTEASPLLLIPLAGLALALSRSPQGEAHV